MHFQGAKHRNRFAGVMNASNKSLTGIRINKYAACMYLLTADDNVWLIAKEGVTDDGFNFNKMPIEDIGVVGYTLIKCAEDMWFSTGYTTLFDLCETEELDTRIISAIINAVTIYRYGFRYNGGMKISAQKG